MQFYLYTEVANGEIDDRYELISAAAPNLVLNTMQLDSENLKKALNNQTFQQNELNSVVAGESRIARRIMIKPKCADTVDFVFKYTNAFGEEISQDTLQGPTVDDIFAVKEKVFLPLVVGKLLQRTCNLPTDRFIPVTYEQATLFEINKTQIQSPVIPFFENLYPSDFTNLVNDTSIIFYEKGAAAFFGVHKKLTIPRDTRTIEVMARFNHTSFALNLEPDTGLDVFDSDELRGMHTNYPPKFFKAGVPKAGIATMKLCLYDNEFKRTIRYPHYYMPRQHIW